MTEAAATGTPSAYASIRGGSSALTRTRVRAAWTFIAPTLIVLALVAGWPLARTIWFSLTDADLNNLGDYTFIGFENYLANYDGEWFGLLTDPDWWLSVWNTVWFALVSVSIETVLGTIVALILNAAFPGRGVMRAIILIPWAIPTVVSAKMWNWMLHDQFGVINDMLLRLGLIAAPITWTANPVTALWTVVMVDVWKTTPFMALLILAALQMLPQDIYEAAKVDGVHPVRVFFRVTLPLIKPALLVAVIFRTLDALRVFDLIYVLTANSRDTMSMSVFARQQLVDFQEVGLGSAASTLIFLIIALLVVITMAAGRVRLGGDSR
ncbi:carbohydrate ABC transporter permease [Microvirga lenta]|uniref:carbohydrate ABC transporter permease n=1 Tax=Microvirga lenta TaxID=2881337 RepID=UPI001CFFC7F5|nr:sugar ABC transporter permease [Microvirga lenta]MCB5177051.1 sugar ABC transporter permease [Microvirga lenta]